MLEKERGDTMAWSNEVFAKNLRYYMESRGKNQKELAEIVGVSAPTMNDWLKAKKYPRIDKIEIMAKYFGILKSDLIEEKTIENSPKEMAQLHYEMIMDEDLVEIFRDLQFLDARERKIVKDLAHSLEETKKEEA